jgi:hypothetical protein
MDYFDVFGRKLDLKIEPNAYIWEANVEDVNTGKKRRVISKWVAPKPVFYPIKKWDESLLFDITIGTTPFEHLTENGIQLEVYEKEDRTVDLKVTWIDRLGNEQVVKFEGLNVEQLKGVLSILITATGKLKELVERMENALDEVKFAKNRLKELKEAHRKPKKVLDEAEFLDNSLRDIELALTRNAILEQRPRISAIEKPKEPQPEPTP